ncbi:MAG: tetratricopeptide repeat protein, partial [Nitrospinota bacterium]
MKKNTTFYFLLFLCVTAVEPWLVAAGEYTSSRFSNDITENKNLKKALLSFEAAAEQKDIPKIDVSFSQIAKIRFALETETLPFVSEYLLKKGDVLFNMGESPVAVAIMENVKETFPADYRPYFSLSRVYLSQTAFHPVCGLQNLVAGISVFVSSTAGKGEFGTLSALFFLTNLTITGYMVLLLIMVRHFKLTLFDLARIFHLPLSSPVFVPLTISFFLIPFLLGGPFTLFLTMPFLVWPYLKSSKEMFIIMAFTALLIMLAPLHIFFQNALAETSSYQTRKLEEFTKNSWDRDTLEILDKQISQQTDSVWLITAKALIYKWSGEINRSYAIFNRLYGKFPENQDVLINLGNYKMTTGRLKEAKVFYERALETNPDLAEARYNLSVTLDAMMEFEAAKEEFEKAYNLDSELIQRFLESKKEKTGFSEPMDKFPSGPIPVFKSDEGRETAPGRIMDLLSAPLKKENTLEVLSVWVIFLALFLGFRRKYIVNPVEQCDECGTIFYKESACKVCTALMLPHSRVEPLERKKFIERLGNFQFMKKIFPTI